MAKRTIQHPAPDALTGEIDWDTLLADLQSKADAAQNGAVTTEELSKRLGKSTKLTRRIIRDGLASGRIERVTVMVDTIRGNKTPVPAWKIKGHA